MKSNHTVFIGREEFTVLMENGFAFTIIPADCERILKWMDGDFITFLPLPACNREELFLLWNLRTKEHVQGHQYREQEVEYTYSQLNKVAC